MSAAVALIGFVVAWRRAREAALRKEDVHTWSNAVIRNLQSLVIVCQKDDAEGYECLQPADPVDPAVPVDPVGSIDIVSGSGTQGRPAAFASAML